jgi:hypothetical protein
VRPPSFPQLSAFSSYVYSVFHLVALRRTLGYLHLEENPSIDDDAVPALLLLNKLRFLSLLDTGVHMPGIRRLAAVLKTESRRLDVTIPLMCEDYLNRMSRATLRSTFAN